MKIKIKDISASGSYFEFTLPSNSLDVDTEFWRLSKDVDVRIEGYRIGNHINLAFFIESEKTIVCNRCLEEISSGYGLNFVRQIKFRDELEEIDVSELVREEIILTIGVKQLCDLDCKGLCPVCGGNKNKGKCSCDL